MSILRISSLSQILGLQLEGVPPKKALPKKGVVHLKKLDNHAKHVLFKRILGGKSMGKGVELPDKPEPAEKSSEAQPSGGCGLKPDKVTVDVGPVKLEWNTGGEGGGGGAERPDGSSDNK